MSAMKGKKKKGGAGGGSSVLAVNRAASHEYHLLQRFEAGLVLTGTEVKSARAGQVNLKDAYATVREGEAYLLQAHFSPYAQGNRANHEPRRPRKLLLNAHEIRKLDRETVSGGTTIVPTKLYLTPKGKIKIEIALARGKQLHDKRDTARRKEAEREMERARDGRY